MNLDFREWRRVVKLDPGRVLAEERMEAVFEWAPDAVIVGGSGGYGLQEVAALLARLRPSGIPLALEISDARALCPGFDVYFVPMVLNSRETDWVIGHHHAAVKRFAHLAEWDKLVVEGYCILNPGATAARLSKANTELGTEDVVAFALLAEHLLKLPIFYLEYSGTYGDPSVVRAVAEVLGGTRLWYGGGIREPDRLAEMASLADTIVVGNAVYESRRPSACLVGVDRAAWCAGAGWIGARPRGAPCLDEPPAGVARRGQPFLDLLMR